MNGSMQFNDSKMKQHAKIEILDAISREGDWSYCSFAIIINSKIAIATEWTMYSR